MTIAALCDELGVSKGSFYHHFGGWPGFVTALLETWERESTLEVKDSTERIDAVGTKYRLLATLVDTIPHDAEAALRVWAHTDPLVKAAVDRVDSGREAMVTDFFALTIPKRDAAMLAELYLSALVGNQLGPPPGGHPQDAQATQPDDEDDRGVLRTAGISARKQPADHTGVVTSKSATTGSRCPTAPASWR